ncbi:MAG: Fe-S oxidoreductase [Gammaproteobacteria bacterium]|nr:Fe-S oxidoreductase [Gammaproteobacteria bacterium]NNF59975.1 Fe-S oxidoreductase [Gammaproteobacteria bacterium]NNM21465.1 Fe-S oxidoreductase [Gammaproteobacteria bacterium]
MSDKPGGPREGSLEAPTRHPIDWKSDDFWDADKLHAELERVYDICHGCRRCFSLCHAFPTLFDAVDESDTGEVDGISQAAVWEVVDHCYLCDMCYMSKCPYVPPHPWQIDFPHLMLRAKAQRFKKDGSKLREKVLSSTDRVGQLAGIPVIAQTVNAVNSSKAGRAMLEKTVGVHRDAPVPEYHSKPLRKREKARIDHERPGDPTDSTLGRVVLFTTCYGNRNEPELGEDLITVFEHNRIPVRLSQLERCCGMPKLEQGDLDSVARLKEVNVPALAALVDKGWDLTAPIPSCVLMFRQELPLMFPDDEQVAKVAAAFFDPFEYLMLRHKAGKLNTEFSRSLGKVAWHVACHLRVQNVGMKTRDVLKLIPDTEIKPIERCSGHDGTYGVKKEYFDIGQKICRPVVREVERAEADWYASDCPMAGHQISVGVGDDSAPTHPMRLLRMAYGLVE